MRLHLKTRHGWCFAADDLVNQGWVLHVVADALQRRSDQSLAGKTVTARAIDAEQLAAVVNGTLQFKAGLDVGISLGTPKNPEHQYDASGRGRDHKSGDQAAPSIGQISIS